MCSGEHHVPAVTNELTLEKHVGYVDLKNDVEQIEYLAVEEAPCIGLQIEVPLVQEVRHSDRSLVSFVLRNDRFVQTLDQQLHIAFLPDLPKHSRDEKAKTLKKQHNAYLENSKSRRCKQSYEFLIVYCDRNEMGILTQ